MPLSARCSRSGVSSPSGCAGGRRCRRRTTIPRPARRHAPGRARPGGPAGSTRRARSIATCSSAGRHHAEALRTLRDLAIDERNWDEAIALQERLLDIAPPADRPAESSWLAVGYYELGRLELARGRRRRAPPGTSRPPSAPIGASCRPRVALGDAYEADGLHRDAVRTWERAAETEPALPLLARLERAYRQDARPSRMIALYRNAASRAPDDLALAAALGRVYFELEMLDEATEQFEKLEMRAPDMPVVHAFLGAVFERRGEARAAFDEYRRALRLGHAFDWPHRCHACSATAPTWQDRCPQCQRWNTLRPSQGR